MPGFTFDGRDIPFQEGDTVAAALHRAGVKVLGRSLKYHRPRGIHCNVGSCGSCLVDVDDEPNVPACMRPASHDAVVRSQNRIGSAKHDVLAVVDKVYRSGFEPHTAFTRPRFVNEAFLKTVRFMSGLGRAPPSEVDVPAPPSRHLETDVLVVGAGSHGLAAAEEHASTGLRVLLVDEAEHPGGDSWDHRPSVAQGIEFMPKTVCFGVYGSTAALMTGAGPAATLATVSAKRWVFATGRHDAWPLFPNNDLPGVLTLRGALRLLASGVLPGRLAVVHGPLQEGHRRRFVEAGMEIVAQGVVEDVEGSTHVQRARVDGRWRAVDTVLVDGPGQPRIELLQQAGIPLTFQDGALRPVSGSHEVAGVEVQCRFSTGGTA